MSEGNAELRAEVANVRGLTLVRPLLTAPSPRPPKWLTPMISRVRPAHFCFFSPYLFWRKYPLSRCGCTWMSSKWQGVQRKVLWSIQLKILWYVLDRAIIRAFSKPISSRCAIGTTRLFPTRVSRQRMRIECVALLPVTKQEHQRPKTTKNWFPFGVIAVSRQVTHGKATPGTQKLTTPSLHTLLPPIACFCYHSAEFIRCCCWFASFEKYYK